MRYKFVRTDYEVKIMDYFIYGMIIFGACLMVYNVISYLLFMKSTRDVILLTSSVSNW